MSTVTSISLSIILSLVDFFSEKIHTKLVPKAVPKPYPDAIVAMIITYVLKQELLSITNVTSRASKLCRTCVLHNTIQLSPCNANIK